MVWTERITVPRGFWHDGVHHRDAVVRAPTGADEAFLADEAASWTPAERVTALLTRCVRRLGPDRPVEAGHIRALCIGDREALLLHVRRMDAGDLIRGVVTCPAPDCGRDMDVDLRITDLLTEPPTDVSPTYEAAIRLDGSTYGVRFRLPTGGDQERAARLVMLDPSAVVRSMIEACVERVTVGDSPLGIDLPAPLVAAMEPMFADLDPQAETRLRLTCPACERSADAILDAAALVLGELARRTASLANEVLLLAGACGWTEADILGLGAGRRRRYALAVSATHDRSRP